MDSPCEMSFECKPHLKMHETQKLEEFLSRLEEERHKIEAFKRELPLCTQLITDAMEASRQRLQTGKSKPVLEEFIPINKGSDSSENDAVEVSHADRSSWMTSAQLWNQEPDKTHPPPHEAEIKFGLNGGKSRMGAFHPFPSRDKSSPSEHEGFPELALASNHSGHDIRSSPESKRDHGGGGGGGSTAQRKARRCWSPDLHRRFVKALQILGGSQVATPKQIRELMKVDGLTNDEVKSHLQKYRLHTRRPSPTPQAAVPAPPQVVVLGGIWVPPEYAAAAAAAQSGAPAAALYAPPPHPFCSPAAAVPQELHPGTAPSPPSSVHRHHHHAGAHRRMYNKPPLTQSQINLSPESGVQGGGNGNPSESIEDGKSESGSWKVDSGMENAGERRRAEGGEECNTSIVSLKF